MTYTPTSYQNTGKSNKMTKQYNEYHSVMWSVLFLVNLLITFSLFYYVINQTVGFKSFFHMFSTNSEDFNNVKRELNNGNVYLKMKDVKKSLAISVIITVISNILHLVFLLVLPTLYIQLHLVTTLVCSLIPAVLLFLPQTSSFLLGDNAVWGIISILFSAGLGIFAFIYRRKFVNTSASILKTSVSLLKKHPSLLLVDIIESFILLIMNIMFIISGTVIKSSEVSFSPIIYVYGVFTYYWIIMTVYYTCYMTTAGVIGYEFYLGNSDLKPKNLVLFSFKRAVTQQFGCAALAGFILAFIQTLKFLVELLNPKRRKNKKKERKSDDDDDDEKEESAGAKILLSILYYVLSCILSLAESYFSYISRQALIYCAIFGCSYKEGTDRFNSKGFVDKLNKLQHESIISGALSTNYLLFMIIAGLFIAYSNICKDSLVFLTIFSTEILMLAFFTFANSLVNTASDTLLLCFLENPSILRKSYQDIYYNLQKVKYE